MYELVVERTIAAAHYLRNYPGKCAQLHGHNWRVRVYVRGQQLNETGMIADFGVLKQALGEVTDQYDHRVLNDHPDFAAVNPTTEHLARHIAEKMSRYDFGSAVRVHRVEVRETPNQAVTYYLPE